MAAKSKNTKKPKGKKKVNKPNSERPNKSSGKRKEASETDKRGLKEAYRNHPVFTFVLLLLIFSVVIGISYISRQPDTTIEEEEIESTAKIFDVNEPLDLKIQGRVESGGSLTIYSQVPGIVSRINVEEGSVVYPGRYLVNLSQNYSGGNAASVQRQIAENQLENTNNTLQTQLELINLQREIAEKVDDNADELRSISERSIGATEEIIDLNQEVLDTLNENLEFLEENNENNQNSEAILNLKQAIAGVKGGQLQLQTSLRNLKYQTADDNPPAELSDRQREVTILGLDLQEKGLYLGRDIAELSVKAARIGESVYYPQSPVKGVIEKIYAVKDQPIQAGTPLAVISTKSSEVQISALIPEIFQKLLKSGASTEIKSNLDSFPAEITYISDIPVQGSLYSVKLLVKDPNLTVTPGEYLEISLKTAANCQKGHTCLIPVSAITKSQNETSLLIARGGIAEKKVVTTGDIAGGFVELIKGVDEIELIITERNIIEGDKISVK